MMEHLPVLPVLIPLLTAPLVVMFAGSRSAWLGAVLASLGSSVMSLLLIARVLAHGPLSYELGGWPPPFGIVYIIDEANALVLATVSILALATLWFSGRASASEISADRQTVFYALFLLCLTGLLGIAATADAFNVFVFLEVSSLATYALVAAGPQRRALLAAFQYLILGTLGGSFLLIGLGLLYQATGSLNMADMATRLPDSSMPRVVAAGAAFVLLGLALKSALFPMHQWLPNVYVQAPSAVSAFLAGAATKVAIYAMARFAFGVLGVVYVREHAASLLQALALAAMLYGSILAVTQNSLRRILAYSSIAQIGYLVFGLGLATIDGATASFVHLVNHALIKGALFLAAGCLVYRLGQDSLTELHGLARRMPWTFALLIVAGLSLIGVPLTAGFISKWTLVQATLAAGHTVGLVIIVLSSLLAVVYVGRILEAAYRPAPADAKRHDAPAALLLPAWALTACSIYLGINATALVSTAQLAAQRLVGAG